LLHFQAAWVLRFVSWKLLYLLALCSGSFLAFLCLKLNLFH
jgi:hypothetical protein